MKKVLICLLLVACFFTASCKKNDSTTTEPTYKYHYDFRSSDDMKADFKSYWVEIKTDSGTMVVMENNNYTYFSKNKSYYLIDKTKNTEDTYNIYYLDHSEYTKEISGTSEENSLLDSVLKYLTAHFAIADSDFEKSESTTKIANLDCYSYSYIGKGKDYYYVSKDTEYCMKREITVDDVTSGWEITKLSFNENIIGIEIDSYANYELIQSYTFYNEWPTTTLSELVPKFLGGDFVTACDNGTQFEVTIKAVSQTEIDNYVAKLVLYGFETNYSSTDEFNHYHYVGSNTDNILVTIGFDPANSYQFSLCVKYSNPIEISEAVDQWK